MMGTGQTSRRGRGRLKPEANINLTSLLDIMCNLLIVFMLIAPSLKHGLNIDVAKTDGGTPVNAEEPVTVSIGFTEGDPDPRLYVDTERVTLDSLRTRLEARRDMEPDLNVLIEASAKVPTETTLQVLGIIIDLGIHNYGFITEPREQAPPAGSQSATG